MKVSKKVIVPNLMGEECDDRVLSPQLAAALPRSKVGPKMPPIETDDQLCALVLLVIQSLKGNVQKSASQKWHTLCKGCRRPLTAKSALVLQPGALQST